MIFSMDALFLKMLFCFFCSASTVLMRSLEGVFCFLWSASTVLMRILECNDRLPVP
jgi:hypothetical protein